jgi:hypothetical protein
MFVYKVRKARDTMESGRVTGQKGELNQAPSSINQSWFIARSATLRHNLYTKYYLKSKYICHRL